MTLATRFSLLILAPLLLLMLACGGGVSKAFEPTAEGVALYRQGETEAAIEKFDLAIRLDSNFAPAYTDRGAAYNVLEDYERAIEDHEEAIRLNPEYATAYNNRGFARYNLNRFELALADFNEAIRLQPVYPEAYSGRALTHASLGNDSQSDTDYETAVEFGMDAEILTSDLEQAREQQLMP